MLSKLQIGYTTTVHSFHYRQLSKLLRFRLRQFFCSCTGGENVTTIFQACAQRDCSSPGRERKLKRKHYLACCRSRRTYITHDSLSEGFWFSPPPPSQSSVGCRFYGSPMYHCGPPTPTLPEQHPSFAWLSGRCRCKIVTSKKYVQIRPVRWQVGVSAAEILERSGLKQSAACYIQYPGYTFKSREHTKNVFFAACGASRLSSKEF
jgi:hypothetical protein